MHRASLIRSLAFCALLWVVVGCTSEARLEGVVRTPSLEVGSLSLPDATGAETPMRAEPGGLLLVYFGYTSCPDVCPTTMADISAALVPLAPEERDRISVAMVTVDPERDDAATLTGYLDHFFAGSHALRTDDPDRLEQTAAAFGVQWEIEEHEPGEAYDVAHTAVTFVVDDAGRVRVEWPFGLTSESMTSDLRVLLERESV